MRKEVKGRVSEKSIKGENKKNKDSSLE